MKLKLLVAALAVSFSVQSFAGLLIDPYVGVVSNQSALDMAAGDDSDESSSTSTFGARVGASFLLFSAGVDYQMMAGDTTVSTTSAFVGVDLPILLRFWGEYIFASDLEADDEELDSVDFEFKDGYSVGIGFTGLPLVSLNLEYQVTTYEFELLGDNTYVLGSTVLSVSFPIDL